MPIPGEMSRTLISGLLILAGLIACAFGALVFVSIPRSDTATSSLVWFGISFAIPGLAAIVAGALLRRPARRE